MRRGNKDELSRFRRIPAALLLLAVLTNKFEHGPLAQLESTSCSTWSSRPRGAQPRPVCRPPLPLLDQAFEAPPSHGTSAGLLARPGLTLDGIRVRGQLLQQARAKVDVSSRNALHGRAFDGRFSSAVGDVGCGATHLCRGERMRLRRGHRDQAPPRGGGRLLPPDMVSESG